MTFEDNTGDGFGFDMRPLLDLSPEAEATVRSMVEAMRTPLSPGDPRRHHYVPQFLLRRFSADGQIARVRLEQPDRHEIARVNNVAVMKDLYTVVDNDVGETVSVERLLAVLDGNASGALERMSSGAFPPTMQDRIDLAMWISMQSVRGLKTRRSMEALADMAMKMQMSLVHDEASARAHLRGEDGPDPDPELVQQLLEAVDDMDTWEIAPHQNQMVQLMLEAGMEAAPFLLGRFWAVVIYPENGLVLTDEPVVLYQKPENRVAGVGVGLATADEVWLPLDRHTALILHGDEVVGHRVIAAPAEATVDDFNQTIVNHAFRELYCHEEDLPRLDRLVLPDPDRPLFEASGIDFVKGSTDGVNSPPERRGHHRYRRHNTDT